MIKVNVNLNIIKEQSESFPFKLLFFLCLIIVGMHHVGVSFLNHKVLMIYYAYCKSISCNLENLISAPTNTSSSSVGLSVEDSPGFNPN